MTGDDPVVSFYNCESPADKDEHVLEICREFGLDVENLYEQTIHDSATAERKVGIPYENWDLLFTFYPEDEDLDPRPSSLAIHLGGWVDPGAFDDAARYRQWIDVVYGLVAKAGMALETEAAPIIVPGESEGPPLIGVYADAFFDADAGIEELYEEPAYVATLTDGRTFVIDSHPMWDDEKWRPPTDAEYVESVEITPK